MRSVPDTESEIRFMLRFDMHVLAFGWGGLALTIALRYDIYLKRAVLCES